MENTSPNPSPHFLFIDRQGLLDTVLHALKHEPRIAMDTEADSLHHYYEKLCLIQITAANRHFLLDPLAGLNLQPLFELLQSKKIVFHGADYDLRLLRRTYNFIPARIYDTAVAAQLLGYKAFGLAALIERHFGVVIPKTSQRADWSRRPLTDKMLEYAVNDTCRLLELADILDAELRELGRVEWRRQSTERLIVDTATDREVDHGERWRIHGWRRLHGRQVAILRALWEWRESEGQKYDRPTFKIMGNDLLLDLAVWADENPGKDLREFPHATRMFHGPRFETLKRAIRSAMQLSPQEWPKPPQNKGNGRPDPSVVQRAERLRKTRNSIAETLQLDPGVLAPNWAIAAISSAAPESVQSLGALGHLLPWQAEAVGEAFLQALHEGNGSHASPGISQQSVAV